MSYGKRTTHPPSTEGVADLLDDYRRRWEALQQEARELAQLETEVLGAAERDAAAIVAGAREQISRILSDARRDLQELSKRVDVIVEATDKGRGQRQGTSSAEAVAARATVDRARHDLSRLLDEAKPEIEQLRTDTSKLGATMRQEVTAIRLPALDVRPPKNAVEARPATPQAMDVRPAPTQVMDVRPAPAQVVDVRPTRSPTGELRHLLTERETEASARPERPLFSGLPSAFSAVLQRDSLRVWFIAFAIAAFTTVLGAVWVLRQSGSATTPPPTSSRPEQAPAPPSSDQDPDKTTAPSATTNGASQRPAAPAAGRKPAETPGRGSTPSAAPAERGSRPPVEPTSRGAPPPSGDAAAAKPSATELTTAAQRWFEAYARQDLTTIRSVGTPDMKISDQRAESERLPRTAENLRRALQNVSFQFVGETAILSGRMIELGNVGGHSQQRSSLVSLMWIRENDRWLTADVQIRGDVRPRSR